jgi:hypothetical protein
MGLVFLFVRIALGGFFAWRGVRYLDPYVRHAAIASARTRGWRGSDLTFVTMSLMMLIGGICIVMGIAPVIGVMAAVTALGIDASWRFKNVARNRTTAFAFARIVGLAATAVLTLLVPHPWPFSFIA